MAGKRWQALLNEALSGIYPALEAMTDAELRNVRSAPGKATQTNCWWLASRFAPVLSEIADGILQSRYAERRAAKKRTPNTQVQP